MRTDNANKLSELDCTEHSPAAQDTLNADSDVYSGQGWQRFLDSLHVNQSPRLSAQLG